MAGNNHARVSGGAAAVVFGIAIDHGDFVTLLGCVIGGAEADDAAADNEDTTHRDLTGMTNNQARMTKEFPRTKSQLGRLESSKFERLRFAESCGILNRR